MGPPRIHIDSISDTECLLHGPIVFRIHDRKGAPTDQVCREAGMGVRWVVCITGFGFSELEDDDQPAKA